MHLNSILCFTLSFFKILVTNQYLKCLKFEVVKVKKKGFLQGKTVSMILEISHF